MIKEHNKMENEKYPIKEEWEEYYKVLEGIRRTGVCNMWGASTYLKEFCPELSDKQSQEILCNWIHNYDKLNEKYGWRS
jgi:hypothetical protein